MFLQGEVDFTLVLQHDELIDWLRNLSIFILLIFLPQNVFPQITNYFILTGYFRRVTAETCVCKSHLTHSAIVTNVMATI